MCSSRCDRPASVSFSVTEPVPIQNPRATERTPGMCSVTTRTPESSVEISCPVMSSGSAITVTRASRAAGSPVALAAAAAAARPGRTPGTAVAAATASAAPAADGRELLDRLPGDVGIVGQAQADPAPLTVDLDHPDGDLVALVRTSSTVSTRFPGATF